MSITVDYFFYKGYIIKRVHDGSLRMSSRFRPALSSNRLQDGKWHHNLTDGSIWKAIRI